jgi:nitrate reductase NapE component
MVETRMSSATSFTVRKRMEDNGEVILLSIGLWPVWAMGTVL